MAPWGFYGRTSELETIRQALLAQRFTFMKMTGRRRIGKTTLIRRALAEGTDRVFYVPIPDSTPAGVLHKVRANLAEFGLAEFDAPNSLLGFARLIQELLRAGYVVAVDEFQYFLHDRLREFCSHLQSVVDEMLDDAEAYPGTLIVLGSIHTEVSALLDEKDAPLYARTTHELKLGHLPIPTIRELLVEHGVTQPSDLLFYWTLFEGVPKFYRDCFEAGVFNKPRRAVLGKLFFEEGSPLRQEADNWFLKELKGRYDVVLSYLAEHAGATNAELAENAGTATTEKQQVGGYLKTLTQRYGMVERRLPIFARPAQRKGRYYLTDNFLVSWIGALRQAVELRDFRPRDELLHRVDQRLETVEGPALEKLVRQLLLSRSRQGLPGFNVTHTIQGWWDRGDIELDSVAVDESAAELRIATIKRNADKALADLPNLRAHTQRFLEARPEFAMYQLRLQCISPSFTDRHRSKAQARGAEALDLEDLLSGLES